MSTLNWLLKGDVMQKKFKVFHVILEICLALVCIFIGYFEDAYIMGAFIFACFYNFIYVLFLRKKTGEKVLESIANIILVWGCIINLVIVTYMIGIYFLGYTDNGFLGMGPDTTHYGIDAWLNNLEVIIFSPFVILNFIYMGIYFLLKRKKRSH